MGDIFRDRAVVIAGGASFIGSHLAEALVASGAQVTVVDDLSSGRIENLDTVRDRIRFIEGDLRDFNVAETALSAQDIVFHLANVHGGRGFIETHPAEISQNFAIDANMLRAAELHGVARFCYASSACVYPTDLQGPSAGPAALSLSEDMADPFRPGAAYADGEYGWAKLMGEMSLQAYHRQFGLRGVSCRLFTVYGPRENETHAVIALIAKALLRQDPYHVWGTGTQLRNFTFVADAVAGMMRATARIDDCRAVNIGTREVTRLADAARQICALLEHRPERFHFDTTKPEGVRARAADMSNQIAWLDWEPTTSFANGLRATIGWYSRSKDTATLAAELERKLFER